MAITYVALLRGVNLGGHKKIAMPELCAVAGKAGFEGVRSLLQSGNLVLRSDERTAVNVERRLEAEIARRLKVETDVFVRTASEWQQVIAKNPFPQEAATDPSHLLVVFLRDAPTPERLTALRAVIKGREVVSVEGRQAYIVYPDGIGTSKLTTAIIDRELKTRGTARNWNTVIKASQLMAGS